MKKCLIVEDSKERIEVITALLYHCEITVANSAEEGITLLKDNAYELVFLEYCKGSYHGKLPQICFASSNEIAL